MKFVTTEAFVASTKAELCMFVKGGNLALSSDNEILFPPSVADKVDSANIVDRVALGYLDDKPCEVVIIRENEASAQQQLSELLELDALPELNALPELKKLPGAQWQRLRDLLGTIDDTLFQMAGRGVQLGRWLGEHRFCGRCGATTRKARSDRSLVCTQCELRFYPRISPCIMVLITRGDECLLASGVRHKENMYSALAGFIDAGETAEETVEREVFEEVGLRIKNLQYFSSQPWPFPGQLMFAYTAEYLSGDIRIDETEIVDAKWFKYDNLPQIPPSTTISGQLISMFVSSCQNAS